MCGAPAGPLDGSLARAGRELGAPPHGDWLAAGRPGSRARCSAFCEIDPSQSHCAACRVKRRSKANSNAEMMRLALVVVAAACCYQQASGSRETARYTPLTILGAGMKAPDGKIISLTHEPSLLFIPPSRTQRHAARGVWRPRAIRSCCARRATLELSRPSMQSNCRASRSVTQATD
eukprot:COSAG06_NODE_755_length_12532_cov_10.124990_9_plen_177_part_00